jgi:hypothetical protein
MDNRFSLKIQLKGMSHEIKIGEKLYAKIGETPPAGFFCRLIYSKIFYDFQGIAKFSGIT